MPYQVPVVPADGAVAAAVDPPLVAAPAPGNDKISTKYAHDNVVSVSSCPCIRFPSRVFFRLGVVGLLAWFSLLCY